MTESNKQPTPQPSSSSSPQPLPSQVALATELIRINLLLDSTARERDLAIVEREQARAEAAQATASLTASERALLVSEEALRADARIVMLPNDLGWLRPSGHLLCRINTGPEMRQARDLKGKLRYVTYPDGTEMVDAQGAQLPLMEPTGNVLATLLLNGDPLTSGTMREMQALAAQIKAAIVSKG